MSSRCVINCRLFLKVLHFRKLSKKLYFIQDFLLVKFIKVSKLLGEAKNVFFFSKMVSVNNKNKNRETISSNITGRGYLIKKLGIIFYQQAKREILFAKSRIVIAMCFWLQGAVHISMIVIATGTYVMCTRCEKCSINHTGVTNQFINVVKR